MKSKKYYTTRQVCEKIGITKKTLFLWEAAGKIPKAKRDRIFNFRIYTEKDVRLLKDIAKTKWSRRRKNEKRKKVRREK